MLHSTNNGMFFSLNAITFPKSVNFAMSNHGWLSLTRGSVIQKIQTQDINTNNYRNETNIH